MQDPEFRTQPNRRDDPGEVYIGLGGGRLRNGHLAAAAGERRAPEQEVVDQCSYVILPARSLLGELVVGDGAGDRSHGVGRLG